MQYVWALYRTFSAYLLNTFDIKRAYKKNPLFDESGFFLYNQLVIAYRFEMGDSHIRFIY
jgi:hypothetical protein